VSTFSENNCLNINAGKSKYIIIGSQKNLKDRKNMNMEDVKIGGKN
jgi:hypothetical protein